jgi:hypothetical protein
MAVALVTDLCGAFDAALARAWLIGPGDRCAGCAMATRCSWREACLHLVASAGLSARVDGPFSRFPFEAQPVGEVARTLVPLVLREGLEATGLAEASWLAARGIASFGAWPLVLDGRCAGVFALFSRRALDERDVRALGAFARLASRALVGDAPAPGPPAELTPPTLAETQRRAILRALEITRGRVSGAGGAAELLGMRPTTLESRIRRLGLRKPTRRY